MQILISDDTDPIEAAGLFHRSVNLINSMESHIRQLTSRNNTLQKECDDLATINNQTYNLEQINQCPVCKDKYGIRFVIRPFKLSSCDYLIMCAECGATTDTYSLLHLAVDSWNDHEIQRCDYGPQ